MKKLNRITQEMVFEGHPDKIADTIAEIIHDTFNEVNPKFRIAPEVVVTQKKIWIFGEISNEKGFNKNGVIKQAVQRIKEYIEELGYNEKTWPGIKDLEYSVNINVQSKEIKQHAKKGFGDNSVVYGYANNNKKANHVPPEYFLTRSIVSSLRVASATYSQIFKEHIGADGKILIDFIPEENRIEVVICMQIIEDIKKIENKKILEQAIAIQIERQWHGTWAIERFHLRVIPFTKGGGSADTGVTGRKLLQDNYGTNELIGGGSFAGKDVTKGDKTLALFARWVCLRAIKKFKELDSINLQITTFMGSPTSRISIVNYEGEDVDRIALAQFVDKFSKMTIDDIIKRLEIRQAEFKKASIYGYFGSGNFLWDRL